MMVQHRLQSGASSFRTALMELPDKFTRSDAERTWPQFVRWIGFSTLLAALKRKHASLEEWAAFREITPKLFSIEIGLAKILRRWQTTRKLSFLQDKALYDALNFAGVCITVKDQLSSKQAELFRRRVISEILPSGRLCHLEHEFRVAQNLNAYRWRINQFGFCGEPGPDFVAHREGMEIEVEGKCLSPEIGLGISYEFAARLLSRLSRELRSANPGCLTAIRIELRGHDNNNQIDKLNELIVHSYKTSKSISADVAQITIELSPLVEFLARFPDVKNHNWLQDTFRQIRTRKGDYGFFIHLDEELIFCNLIPARENRQAKNVLKLISKTCERQFTHTRPAVLWLHLQGLDPNSVDDDLNNVPDLFQRLAVQAFRSERRDHLAAIAFSSDTEINVGRAPVMGRNPRVASSTGKVRGFDNPRCKYGGIPVFAPCFSMLAHKPPR
jgi:hypothetical protein